MKIQTSEVKNFMFYKIPQAFFTNEKYSNMSIQAKILYSIINDRLQLSRKNGYVDEEGNLYTIFPYKEMAKVMGVTERSIANYMSELKKHDLVLVKKQGWDLPGLIYLGLPEEDNNEDEKNNNGKKKNNSSRIKKTVADSIINQINNNQINNNNNNNTDAKEDTDAKEEIDTKKDVVISSQKQEKKQENEQKQEKKQDYTADDDDTKRLFHLAQKVSSDITMPLIQKLLKRYSSEQIEEKLIYMQKFQEKNMIYNPCGFLTQSLKDNYTFIDKAKAILEKANKAIAKSYQEIEYYRNIKPASREVSLSWLNSMKMQLQGGIV